MDFEKEIVNFPKEKGCRKSLYNVDNVDNVYKEKTTGKSGQNSLLDYPQEKQKYPQKTFRIKGKNSVDIVEN